MNEDVGDQYLFDELQQELAQLENAFDLDDDDALFAMLDEIHERNVEKLEDVDGGNQTLPIRPPSEQPFEDDDGDRIRDRRRTTVR